jgi:hypothetical protein
MEPINSSIAIRNGLRMSSFSYVLLRFQWSQVLQFLQFLRPYAFTLYQYL